MRTWRNWIIAAGILGALAIGLLLDLRQHGVAWHIAWELTGEETPLAQMRGMIDYAMTQTRPGLVTKPLVPIQHSNQNPYGMNTFLHLEPDPNKIEEQLRMIDEAGFRWIRQQFEWAEIEVDGRGQFTDSRNDMDGDGTVDTISGWRKFDLIVDLAEQHGLQIQARLDNPPDWAHAANPDIGEFAPPDDLQDFVNYATAVAERYKGRIHTYQMWNEPNIYPEWGNQPVDPAAYTEMLCQTYHALKAVDPQIVVITGALAATIELGNLNIYGGNNLQDLVYLQNMYNNGAGDCFDVLSIQAYGLWSGPTDRRMRVTTINIARNRYIRDMMVANGDSHKPIWISEAAWNAVPSEAEHPEPINARYNFGQVTLDQQAEYMPLFYQRTQEEWPWIGVVNYWFFTRPSDRESDQSFYYFRMVEPDYSDTHPTFTPLPIYNTMKDYINQQTPTLYLGVHQMAGHWAIMANDSAQTLAADDAYYNTVLQANRLEFTAHGTDVTLRWRGESISINGETVLSDGDGWQRTTLLDTRTPQTITVTIESSTPAQFDAMIVENRLYAKLYPLFVAIGVSLGMLLLAVVQGLRGRRRRLSFDHDTWFQDVELLRQEIRVSHGDQLPPMDVVGILRDIRDGEDE